MCDCKSYLFIGNDNLSSAIADGGVIPLSAVSCLRGCDVAKQGDAVAVCGQKKAFKVQASFELTAASAAPITVITLIDGIPAPGGTRTITVAGASDQIAIDLQTTVCNGCKCSSMVSFRLTGAAATLDGESVIVEEV